MTTLYWNICLYHNLLNSFSVKHLGCFLFFWYYKQFCDYGFMHEVLSASLIISSVLIPLEIKVSN